MLSGFIHPAQAGYHLNMETIKAFFCSCLYIYCIIYTSNKCFQKNPRSLRVIFNTCLLFSCVLLPELWVKSVWRVNLQLPAKAFIEVSCLQILFTCKLSFCRHLLCGVPMSTKVLTLQQLYRGGHLRCAIYWQL